MYKDQGGTAEILGYLEAVEMLKQTRDEQQAARLIEQHKFVWEHVPTWLLNSKEVSTRLYVTGFKNNTILQRNIGLRSPH